MKILHSPVDIAGQAGIISRAQKKLGIRSDVAIFNQTQFMFECDINLKLDKKSKILSLIHRLFFFLQCLFKYDIFHFHCGISLLPKNIDLYFLRFLKKKTLMHYWGSDIIQTDIALDYTHFTVENLKKIYPDLNNSERRAELKKMNSLVDKCLVCEYSLSVYAPDYTIVRLAVDVNSIPFIGPVNRGEKVVIIHAPSKRDVKGTHYIIEMVHCLKAEGYKIELLLVENTPHQDAMNIYETGDIIVDDILEGPYGVFAIEAMAMGKPVVAHIHNRLIPFYQDVPIMNTCPETLYNNLKILIKNPEFRNELGKKGRLFVEKNHDSSIVAQQLIELYRSL